MIRNHQLPWLKEFLTRLCEEESDRQEVDEIYHTFQKLWHIAKAAEQNPYQRSPKLAEALLAIKPKPTELQRP